MARYIALALTLLASTAHADCHQFFSYRQAYVAPVVAYAAPVYYQAGRDLEAEALADKVARLVTQKLEARLTAPQAVRAKAAAGAFSKCIRCHGPESSVVLDGSAKVDCWTLARWVQMGRGENVPPEMKKLLESMSPEEKGRIADGMLDLGAAVRPKPVIEPGTLE
jgi:cytochrome c553